MKRQLPLIPVTYWTSHKIENTPLSIAVATLVEPHEHEWQFGHGADNGIMCAIGDGRHIYAATQSEELVAFLGATSTHVGSDAAMHWLSQGLNPVQSRHLVGWLCAYDFPTSPRISRQKYHAWRANADPALELYDGLNDYQDPHEKR